MNRFVKHFVVNGASQPHRVHITVLVICDILVFYLQFNSMMWRRLIAHLRSNHTLNCAPQHKRWIDLFVSFFFFSSFYLLLLFHWHDSVDVLFANGTEVFDVVFFHIITTQSKPNALFVQEAFTVIKYDNFMRWNCSFYINTYHYRIHRMPHTALHCVDYIGLREEKSIVEFVFLNVLTFISVHFCIKLNSFRKWL